MAERRSGLGSSGRQRIRTNIGQPEEAGAYERSMFGVGREEPSRGATEWNYPSSSRVAAYQYDYGSQQLRVRFVKYGTPWVYNNVPATVFASFDAAPSKGKYINSTLNHTLHRRATPTEVDSYFNDGYTETS